MGDLIKQPRKGGAGTSKNFKGVKIRSNSRWGLKMRGMKKYLDRVAGKSGTFVCFGGGGYGSRGT